MKKPDLFRSILAVAACKAARGVLRLTGRGGTAAPGKAALFFARDILARTSEGMEIIVVTGTNGKTTTCRMLEHAMTRDGSPCLANKSGANLLSGVTAEISCNADWLGRPKTKRAVIECDEGALKQVVPLIHPKVIVVTNLFRDQLDRYGEITHTRDAIRTGIEKVPESILCLNADDSLVSSLAENVPNRVVWYGVNTPLGDQRDPEVSDAKYCIHCGTPYQYHYHTYAHLGDFYCPHCGYHRQAPEVALTKVEEMDATGTRAELSFGGRTHQVTVGLPAVYNLYNALAAAAAGTAFGLEEDGLLASLADVHSSFGRMETFRTGQALTQMILVKNPAGCNQALSYVTGIQQDKVLVLCLNDRTADGHDISWIWDADYEKLAGDPHVVQWYVFGDRAEDMQLRLKYAGADPAKIQLLHNEEEILKMAQVSALPVFILPNYTSMLSLRKVFSEATGGSAFWK